MTDDADKAQEQAGRDVRTAITPATKFRQTATFVFAAVEPRPRCFVATARTLAAFRCRLRPLWPRRMQPLHDVLVSLGLAAAAYVEP